jgi:carbamoyl-phosphate synthase large subunit
VKKINSIDEIENYYSISKSYSRSGNLLLEEYIVGKEYSVETLTQNCKTHIIAITEKTVKGKDGLFFVEDRHIIPANLNEKEIELIQKTVLKLIDTLNLGDSATHTEIKINKNGVYIVEVGARLGGDFITSDLVPLATGVDMLENVILLALGFPVKVEQSIHMYSGIQFIQSENYNSIKNFIEKNPGLFEDFQIKPFIETELKSSFDRLGYFITVRSNRKELIDILDLKIKED